MKKIRAGLSAKLLTISTLSLTLSACSNNSSVTTPPAVSSAGTYVFSAVGTDPNDGDYAVIGSFTADNSGNISSGVADYNLGSGTDTNVALSGTYSLSGSTATVTLNSSGKGFTDTFVTTLGITGTAPLSSFDGTGSGTLYHQVISGFSPAGNYAYTVKGEGDGTVTGSGSFVAASGGTFTGGTTTYTDGATTRSSSSATGFLNAPQSSGRGQGSLQGNNLAYYVISPTQILALGIDARALLLFPASKS